MRFGKNIKIASLLDYKDQSLVFIKYTALDQNNKSIFGDGNYKVYEDMLLHEVAKNAKKDNVERFFLISTGDYLLNLYPFMIYSDRYIYNRINKLNDKVKVKVK